MSQPQAKRKLSPDERLALSVRAVVFMSRLFEYECRELGVSLAQYRMLLYLRHGPKRAGELAAHAAITRPSLSVLLVALERSGLVKRSAVDGDGRGVKLQLTKKGLATIGRMEQRFGQVLADASEHADRERLVGALSELALCLTEQVGPRVRAADPFKSEAQG